MKVNDLTITTPAVFDYTTIVQDDWSISHVYFRKTVDTEAMVSIDVHRSFPDNLTRIIIDDNEETLRVEFSRGLLTSTNGHSVWVGCDEVSSTKHSSKGIMSLNLIDGVFIARYKLFVGEGDVEHLAEIRLIK